MIVDHYTRLIVLAHLHWGPAGLEDESKSWCQDPECTTCAILLCPFAEPLHYHHDGCPACAYHEDNVEQLQLVDWRVYYPKE